MQMTNVDVPSHVPRCSEAWQTCLGACLMFGLLLPANAEKVLSFQEAYKAKKAAVIEKYTNVSLKDVEIGFHSSESNSVLELNIKLPEREAAEESA